MGYRFVECGVLNRVDRFRKLGLIDINHDIGRVNKKAMKSYKDLDIYNLAFEYAFEVHNLSLKLPKFEL